MALLKSPTKNLPEAAKVVTTTVPSQPVQDIPVTIPPHQDTTTVFSPPPPSVHGLDWQENEFVLNPITKKQNVIELSPCFDYKRRYIYSLLAVTASNTLNYYCRCSVILWRKYSPLGSFPLCDAVSPVASSVMPKSLVSAFVGGGNVIDSSMIFFTQNPNSSELAQYVVQPQYFEGELDKITVNVEDFANVTSIRLWLGCKSVAKLY